MKTEFKTIPLSEIHESPHNPRKHFDAAKLNELAESIKTVGILTPLLVRPNAKGYEIAAGHRRYRAAKLAKVALLPCLVREMSDQEFMELLNIENLQREGVHPLDEAQGYAVLMAAPYKMSVDRLAEKVGRSVKYIYDRAKLLALIAPLQELFWQDKFSPGHAILLARLSPADQQRILGDEGDGYVKGGLFEIEHRLYREDEDGVDDYPIKVRSVAEVNAWIDEHVRFDRTKVDPMLFPETAQAIEAVVKQDPAHVDVTRAVVPITYEHFSAPDVKDEKDRTLTCVSWKRADGKKGSKRCDHAVMGCVVFGPGRGEAFDVCIDKKRCLVHWKDEIKARKKRESVTGSGKAAAKPEKKSEWELEHERQQQCQAEWEQVRDQVIPQVRARIEQIPVGSIIAGYLGKELLCELKRYGMTPARLNQVPPGKTAESFLRHLCWAMVVADLVNFDSAEPILQGLGFKPAVLLKSAQTSAEAPTKKKEAKE